MQSMVEGLVLSPKNSAPLWKRLAWFVLLWIGGVAAVAGIAFLLRLWIGAG